MAASGEEFAFQHSSPHSLRAPFSSPPAPPLNDGSDHKYNITSPLLRTEHDPLLDHDLSQISSDDRRISTFSSVSSLPTSVLHHDPTEQRTPSRSSRPQSIRLDSTESQRRREYAAAFRNPSSVRAMQMKDELEDDSESVTLHRRSGSQYSVRSQGSVRSTRTSPSKRFGRAGQSSPLKDSSKLRKEFPLVLLHCTLLPPASGVYCDNDLFGALLPEEFRKRWAALQERLAMPEVKARGILIPHPQEDYELLEERLLESLDLEMSRIRASHFLHQETSADSGFESASQTDDDNDNEISHHFKCPDCGRGLGSSRDKKWEIKVYAANGLMRAGAWSAAWREMEKVDIEIGLWLPEDVRQEVNSRLEAIKASENDPEPQAGHQDDDYQNPREREVYGSDHHPAPSGTPYSTQKEPPAPTTARPHVGAQFDAEHTVLSVLRDRKNIIIVLLGVLLMYIMTSTNQKGSSMHAARSAEARLPEVMTTIVTSTTVLSATSALANDVEGTMATVAASTTGEQDASESEIFSSQLPPQSLAAAEINTLAGPSDLPDAAKQFLRDEDRE